jgi:putative nucleotidyltransferase with HDIG domain
MFVDLNCSWFKHPFPWRSFKITSESQLATIRGLRLQSVLMFPQESDQAMPSVEGSEPHRTDETQPRNLTSDALDETVQTQTDYHQAVHLATEVYQQVVLRSSQMMKDVCSGSAEGLSNAKVMINGISTLIANTEAASAMASLFDTEELDNVSLLHALNVATLSMMVAKHFKIDEEEMRLIGMGGLLHDIGEQRVPLRIVRNRSKMTRVEALEYQRHAQHSVEMLARFDGFPEEVLDIIRHHHERLDGSGYPQKLKGDQIALPTRIVSGVDQYDSLINNPETEQSLSPAEALAHMYKNQKHLFSPEVIVAMIQTFGVYPPGTVVALTDGTLGLVLNLNMEFRLKPLILAYNPGSPKETPDILDLSRDKQRTIVRAISKHDLPREITEYLCLKRWTGYFIQSSIRTIREHAA